MSRGVASAQRARRLTLALALVAGAGLFAWLWTRMASPPAGAPTFARDVAPIVYEHCAPCHHDGGSGPFPLLTHRQVKKHASDVLDVIESGFMPPWLPERGLVAFADERGLDPNQVETLRTWVRGWMVEGDSRELPPTPQFPDGWTLGAPDLVLALPHPYELPAEARDVFRNFVLPIPVDQTRYVRAVELRPGNPRVVHHAIMRVDQTGEARRLDEADPTQGFGGMDSGGGSVDPDGHFLGWTPGKQPRMGDGDTAWRAAPGMSLVLQMHMKPTGKVEPIEPLVGLYFGDGPPTRVVYPIQLSATTINIPAGERDYVVTDEITLPVDLDLYSIYPHAHYLGKTMQVRATLPDGQDQWLVRIEDWNFDWQDEYPYAEPLYLPAGTRVHMRYTYDNSADNVRNPHDPPRRVVAGNESTDEMGNLLLQVALRDPADRLALHTVQMEHIANNNPGYPFAHYHLGVALEHAGRNQDAVPHYLRAVRLHPGLADAHYRLGFLAAQRNELEIAIVWYRRALQAEPTLVEAQNNLANAYFRLERIDDAITGYRRLLELAPTEGAAHYNLARALLSRGDRSGAERHARQAARLLPDLAQAQELLAELGIESH